jgi:hypothetical protein
MFYMARTVMTSAIDDESHTIDLTADAPCNAVLEMAASTVFDADCGARVLTGSDILPEAHLEACSGARMRYRDACAGIVVGALVMAAGEMTRAEACRRADGHGGLSSPHRRGVR